MVSKSRMLAVSGCVNVVMWAESSGWILCRKLNLSSCVLICVGPSSVFVVMVVASVVFAVMSRRGRCVVMVVLMN